MYHYAEESIHYSRRQSAVVQLIVVFVELRISRLENDSTGTQTKNMTPPHCSIIQLTVNNYLFLPLIYTNGFGQSCLIKGRCNAAQSRRFQILSEREHRYRGHCLFSSGSYFPGAATAAKNLLSELAI